MGRSETAEGEKREIGPLGDSSDVTLADGFTKLLGCRKMQMIVLMFHFFFNISLLILGGFKYGEKGYFNVKNRTL